MLLEAVPDAMILVDETGRVAFANDRTQTLFGYASDELVGQPIEVLVPDRHRVAHGAHRDEYGRNAVTRPMHAGRHLSARRKDGSEFTADIGLSPMKTSDGAMIIVAIRDITDLKKTEAALARANEELEAHGRSMARDLRSAEARYRDLFESSPLPSWVFDPSRRRFLLVNEAAVRQYGYSREELEALGFDALLAPDEEIRDCVERRRRARMGQTLRHRRRDGSIVSVEVNMRDIDFAGTPAWFVVVNDVTERTRAQAALRASEARFARLAESGIIGVAFADTAGTVHDANDAYLDLVGYTREDLAAGSVVWSRMTPPECQAGDERALAQLEETGVTSAWEKELIRKDGSRVSVLIGVAMLEPTSCIAYVADLTERKRAEQALRSTEDQLRQAQKMEAVGRLAGGVAHDFNNMLSVILSYSDFLMADVRRDDPMHTDLAEIQKAGRRAAELTRQLLLFSRQNVVEPKVVDLDDVLGQMGKMLRRVVGEDIELVTSSGRASGKVRVDPTSIEQVVMNLVVNARDAMPQGGKLTIETADVVLDEEFARRHVGVRAGAHVMIAVTDNGVGMDRATQSHIFEPFFTTKERGKGTGLGLSTVFGIVQQAGGTVWVYSELGVGTTFKVYLPRVDERADAVTATRRPSAPPPRFQGTETVLLVEDEDQVRAVAHDILARAGYHVVEARGAGEALLLCEGRADIHLLLTDVVMPQMSGPELARRVRSLRPQTKVLCMSGYTDDSIVRHGVLDASFAFIQKPITPETLARKVREVLEAPPQTETT